MDKDLRARLQQDSGLTTKVGNRIDWNKRPKGGETAITLTVVSAPPNYTYKGRDRLQMTRVQMDCWGPNPGDAKEIAKLLPPIMEQRASIGETRFAMSFVTLDLDGDQEEAAAGKILFRHIIEFAVWHRPAA